MIEFENEYAVWQFLNSIIRDFIWTFVHPIPVNYLPSVSESATSLMVNSKTFMFVKTTNSQIR